MAVSECVPSGCLGECADDTLIQPLGLCAEPVTVEHICMNECRGEKLCAPAANSGVEVLCEKSADNAVYDDCVAACAALLPVDPPKECFVTGCDLQCLDTEIINFVACAHPETREGVCEHECISKRGCALVATDVTIGTNAFACAFPDAAPELYTSCYDECMLFEVNPTPTKTELPPADCAIHGCLSEKCVSSDAMVTLECAQAQNREDECRVRCEDKLVCAILPGTNACDFKPTELNIPFKECMAVCEADVILPDPKCYLVQSCGMEMCSASKDLVSGCDIAVGSAEADPCGCMATHTPPCDFDGFCKFTSTAYEKCKKECAGHTDPCTSDQVEVQCLSEPCNQGCDAYPNAVCKANNCNGCNANYFIEVDGTVKDVTAMCERPATVCASLGCGDCATSPDCSACYGEANLDNGETFSAFSCLPASHTSDCRLGDQQLNTAVSVTELDAVACKAASVTAVTTPSTNPGQTGHGDVDAESYQNVVEVVRSSTVNNIASKFIILISIFVHEGERQDGSKRLQVYKAGVDLVDQIGDKGIPTDSDLDAVCSILKSALQENQGLAATESFCELAKLAVTQKRQVATTHSYAATLEGQTYADALTTEVGASTTLLSAFAIFVSALFALF